MTDIEELARDICWAAFNTPPKGGKIRYWRRIAPGARSSYIKTAEEMIFHCKMLSKLRREISVKGVKIEIESV
jgi:hypothetical protein